MVYIICSEPSGFLSFNLSYINSMYAVGERHFGPSYEKSDRAFTICLARESKANQRIKREGGVANPRRSVVPKSRLKSRKKARNNGMHQFLVPPMNSGRLKVGLATTAPANNCRIATTIRHSNQTCRLIDEELQRKRAAVNSFFPRTIIGRLANPGSPVIVGTS